MEFSREVSELEKKVDGGLAKKDDFFKLGKIYLENGEYEKLISCHERLLNSQEVKLEKHEIAKIYYEKGEAYQLLDSQAEAVSCFQCSIRVLGCVKETLDSVDLKAMNYYSLLVAEGDSDLGRKYAMNSLKYFERMINDYNCPEELYLARSHMADIYLRIKNYEKAIEYYELAFDSISEGQQRVWVLTGMGSIFGKMGRKKKAIYCFNEALIMANDTIPKSKIFYEMGKAYLDLGVLDKASNAFKMAFDGMGDDIGLKNNRTYEKDILFKLGQISYDIGKYEESILYLSEILKIIDKSDWYYASSSIILGHIYLIKMDYIKSQYFYKKALMAVRVTDEEIKVALEALDKLTQLTQV